MGHGPSGFQLFYCCVLGITHWLQLGCTAQGLLGIEALYTQQPPHYEPNVEVPSLLLLPLLGLNTLSVDLGLDFK